MAQANVPLDRRVVGDIVDSQKFQLASASIRELNAVAAAIEKRLGIRFIHMEFGIPGLHTDEVAIAGEIQALKERRVSHLYAPYDGVPELKEEAATFVKLFMNVDVPPTSVVPTIGAMHGCFGSLALAGRMAEGKRTILFLEPSFPSNKLQTRFLGLDVAGVDLYDHRGESLIAAIEAVAQKGSLAAVFWSSPNNPSWVVLKESELQGIARVCDEYGALAIEDLAYFGMDTRQNYYVPGKPPYQPTVLRYTPRSISIISTSKVFSYAGQRCGLTITHPELMQMSAPALRRWTGTDNVGHAFVHGTLYPMISCVPESPQYGLLALLRAVNRGETRAFDVAKEYTRRAKVMKRLFLENGFRLVYDNDLGEPLADGFYFTIAYPAYANGGDLLRELIHYGISAVTLETTGSTRIEGLRACVSMTGEDQFDTLAYRLRRFHEDHPL